MCEGKSSKKSAEYVEGFKVGRGGYLACWPYEYLFNTVHEKHNTDQSLEYSIGVIDGYELEKEKDMDTTIDEIDVFFDAYNIHFQNTN